MKILGIESSCDDTSVAIVDSNKNVLSNERVSQNNIHQLYKGVVPELAARNHVLHIDKITKKALKKCKCIFTGYKWSSCNCWSWFNRRFISWIIFC